MPSSANTLDTPVKVTVLMTLYNKGAFVEAAVQSVLAQSFTGFELLIVDDASTDGGLENVRAISDPRIRILESQQNTGRPASANRGFNAARGQYVAILDADDLMHPDRLQEQQAFLDEHPEVAAVGSWLQCFGSRDALWQYPLTDREIRGQMLWRIDVTYPSCMLRRSVLDAHGIRCNEQWLIPGMDFFFMLNVGLHGSYANIPKALTHYRVGSQNMRHGRDALADRVQRNEAALRLFGLPTENGHGTYMALLEDPDLVPITRDHVSGIHHLIGQLSRLSRERDLFPADVFEGYMARRWDLLYHALPKYSAAAWTYLMLRKQGRTSERIAWSLRATAKRILHVAGIGRKR